MKILKIIIGYVFNLNDVPRTSIRCMEPDISGSDSFNVFLKKSQKYGSCETFRYERKR